MMMTQAQAHVHGLCFVHSVIRGDGEPVVAGFVAVAARCETMAGVNMTGFNPVKFSFHQIHFTGGYAAKPPP